MRRYRSTSTVLFSLLAISITISSCEQNRDEELTELVNDTYAEIIDLYDEKVDGSLSTDLVDLVNESRAVTDQSIKEIEASDHPTDRPASIEGPIFCSLYEGYDTHKIKQIDSSDDGAKVLVEFHNNIYDETWTDTVLFVNDGGWKLDNVLYFREFSTYADLKSSLTSFVVNNQ